MEGNNWKCLYMVYLHGEEMAVVLCWNTHTKYLDPGEEMVEIGLETVCMYVLFWKLFIWRASFSGDSSSSRRVETGGKIGEHSIEGNIILWE